MADDVEALVNVVSVNASKLNERGAMMGNRGAVSVDSRMKALPQRGRLR